MVGSIAISLHSIFLLPTSLHTLLLMMMMMMMMMMMLITGSIHIQPDMSQAARLPYVARIAVAAASHFLYSARFGAANLVCEWMGCAFAQPTVPSSPSRIHARDFAAQANDRQLLKRAEKAS